MGNIIKNDNLTLFGKMIAEALDERGWKLQELAEKVGSNPASMSRFMRLKRRPPARILDRLIEVFAFNEAQAAKLRKLAQQGLKLPERMSSGGIPFSFRAMRRFADYDLRALITLVRSLGWYLELNEEDDDYAFDIKVAEADGLESFVAINLPNPRRMKPEVLLKGAKAMAGVYEGVKVTLFYEGVAGALAAHSRVSRQSELPLEDEQIEDLDSWLKSESRGKGRIVHGGNLIQVLAEYLDTTEAVQKYLQAHHR
jgi:transcriptional regulator with XRE-family HTH domain